MFWRPQHLQRTYPAGAANTLGRMYQSKSSGKSSWLIKLHVTTHRYVSHISTLPYYNIVPLSSYCSHSLPLYAGTARMAKGKANQRAPRKRAQPAQSRRKNPAARSNNQVELKMKKERMEQVRKIHFASMSTKIDVECRRVPVMLNR